MNFLGACEKKFRRGAKEHKQIWDAEHINARKEIMGELTDLFNYSTLYENRMIALEIQKFAEGMWNTLNDIQPKEGRM